MRRKKRFYARIAAGVLFAVVLGIHFIAPRVIENKLNGVFIADLHEDSLLWGRDLRVRSNVGHLDLPRMREGHLALQAFAITTKTPRNLNIEPNDDTTDNVFWLALVSAWPPSALSSLKARTLYLASRLAQYTDPGNQLRRIRTRDDLAEFYSDWQQNPHLIAGFLSIEGLHALEGNLATLEDLENAGVRLIGLAHFFDNEVAGSAHGMKKGGLTSLGRQVVPELERRNILIDLAHSSPQTIEETLAIAKKPLVVSHTGVKGTCDNMRNLSDQQLRAIAATGGLIGIGYWEEATCGRDVGSITRAIAYAVKIVGLDHVALGSDFDGSTFAPFDAAGLVQLTQGLIDIGLDEKTIAAVMGENVRRLLLSTLPPREQRALP